MQANNATRATNGNPPTRPLYKHLTNTLYVVLKDGGCYKETQ